MTWTKEFFNQMSDRHYQSFSKCMKTWKTTWPSNARKSMILVRSWREPSPRPGRSYLRSRGRTSTRCTQGFSWVISKYRWYHIYNTGTYTWSVANQPNIEKFYLFYSNLNHHLIVNFFREGVKISYDFVIFHVLNLCTLLLLRTF